jgi:hypothetical protein
MTIAAYYVEQNRHDTSRVVHYAGGDLKEAKARARELSETSTKNCAWVIEGNKPLLKFYDGKELKPNETA